MRKIANKLMHFMLLSCKDATKYISIKNMAHVPWYRKLQLKIHISMCDSCKKFAEHSDYIDEKIEEAINTSNASFSSEQKTELQQKLTHQH